MKLHIDSIKVGLRARKALGRLGELMDSLSTVGLLHPVVIGQDHVLIAGQRRLEAAKRLGWKHVETTVVGIEDAALALRAELEENRNRRALLPSEAIEAGMRLEVLERAVAAKRKLSGVKQASKGNTRDKVGKAIGMSGRTYECGREVLEAAEREPDKYSTLPVLMDAKGVHTAHRIMRMVRGDTEPPILFLADAFKAVMVKHPEPRSDYWLGSSEWATA